MDGGGEGQGERGPVISPASSHQKKNIVGRSDENGKGGIPNIRPGITALNTNAELNSR